MPVERAMQPRRLLRPSPLPKTRYVIPKRLPEPYGVDELFDWSSSKTPGHAVSSRPASAGSNRPAFRRHHQRSKSPLVQSWVDSLNEKDPVLKTQKKPLPARSDIVSISSSSSARPLFTPSSSPPPTDQTTFTAPLPLPTPAPSPPRIASKLPAVSPPTIDRRSNKTPSSSLLSSSAGARPEQPRPKHLETKIPQKPRDVFGANDEYEDLEAWAAQESGRKGEAIMETQRKWKGKAKEGSENAFQEIDVDKDEGGENVAPDQYNGESHEGESESSDGDGESDSDSEDGDKKEGESVTEGPSDTSSEIGDDGRMRGPVYLDLAAKADRFSTKPYVQASKSNQSRKTENEGETGWTGASQGVLSFRKRPHSQETIPPGKWSFSGDGATRQPTKDRAVGDIHFSPGFSGGPKSDYWVLHGSPKTRWVSCKEGHPHPELPGYVLGPREGTKPPRWIRPQSLRVNKCRARKSV
ncbi:hypothetical protein FRC09_005490 [Ceratobasidium sp. 395]|nr:hypothetical protein FRC09_005490 [Ceratobasidium sp. 395]